MHFSLVFHFQRFQDPPPNTHTHRKSAINGLIVKSGKFDRLKITEITLHILKHWDGQEALILVADQKDRALWRNEIVSAQQGVRNKYLIFCYGLNDYCETAL